MEALRKALEQFKAGTLTIEQTEQEVMALCGYNVLNKRDFNDPKNKINTCNICGNIAAFNDAANIHICNACKNRTDFSYLEIPYACKLLFQELNTMNISPRIITETHKKHMSTMKSIRATSK